jgi:DNA repair exonuclease SbcCD ATPase subunit
VAKRPNRRDLTERNLPPVKELHAYVKRLGKTVQQLKARIRELERRVTDDPRFV